MPRPPKIVERKIQRHRGKIKKLYGLCYFDRPLIELDPRQRPSARLDTLVHEALHHAFPDMSERQVARAATIVARILWQDNYRRVSQ